MISVTVQNVWYERDGCGGEIAVEWLIWVRNIWTFGVWQIVVYRSVADISDSCRKGIIL